MKPVPLDTETPFGRRSAPWAARAAWRVATEKLPSSVKRRLRRVARGWPGPFDVRVPGLFHDPGTHVGTIAFRAYPTENYCDRVLVGQGRLPEWKEHEALRPQITHDCVFVDIGANVGAYSAFVGFHAKSARIVAVEPHPRTAAKLRFNLAANGIEADVVEAAVGREPGSMNLWSDGGGNIGQTSLLPEATSNAKVAVGVEVVTLADALAERGVERIDLLKIDVEGFEDRALVPFLAGASRSTLPRAILLEREHSALWEDDLSGLMRRLGYRETFASGQNALLVLAAKKA